MENLAAPTAPREPAVALGPGERQVPDAKPPHFAADHAAHTGRELGAPDIAAAALTGDGAAVASLDRYIDRLARGLATVINLVDPDVIVLGGGMSNIASLYDSVPRRWQQFQSR